MNETPIFEAPGISVTPTRFSVPGRTYPIRGVTMVESVLVPADWPTLIAWGVFGGIALVVALACGVMSLSGGSAWLAIGGIAMVGAIVAGGFGGWTWYNGGPWYVVQLVTAGGRSECLRTRDSKLASGVTAALTDAISRGG